MIWEKNHVGNLTFEDLVFTVVLEVRCRHYILTQSFNSNTCAHYFLLLLCSIWTQIMIYMTQLRKPSKNVICFLRKLRGELETYVLTLKGVELISALVIILLFISSFTHNKDVGNFLFLNCFLCYVLSLQGN